MFQIFFLKQNLKLFLFELIFKIFMKRLTINHLIRKIINQLNQLNWLLVSPRKYSSSSSLWHWSSTYKIVSTCSSSDSNFFSKSGKSFNKKIYYIFWVQTLNEKNINLLSQVPLKIWLCCFHFLSENKMSVLNWIFQQCSHWSTLNYTNVIFNQSFHSISVDSIKMFLELKYFKPNWAPESVDSSMRSCRLWLLSRYLKMAFKLSFSWSLAAFDLKLLTLLSSDTNIVSLLSVWTMYTLHTSICEFNFNLKLF